MGNYFLVLFLHNFIIRGDVYLHVYIDLGMVFILRIFLIVEFLRQTSACLFGILFLCSSISRGGVYFVHFSSWCLF